MSANLTEAWSEELKKNQPIPEPIEYEDWEPEMSPSQREFFWDTRRIVLAVGERRSGKTIVALDKLIAHCYRWNNAVAIIYVITKDAGIIGGAWDKLTNEEYDQNGNEVGRLNYWHNKVALKHGPERVDGILKMKFVDIVNRHGGLSRVYYKSLPPGSTIRGRMKGMEPSFVLIEEITETSNSAYFTKTLQQIRRAGIPAEARQLVMTGNPPENGPDHWLSKMFISEGIASLKTEDELQFDHNNHKRIGWHHVRMSENRFLSQEERSDYIEDLAMDAITDPTARARDIEGRWKRRQSSRGLFEGFWIPELLVRPYPPDPSRGLMLIPGDPVIVGYDPGDSNQAKSIQQRHWTSKGWIYRIVDEIVVLKKLVILDDIVREIMDRLAWWNRRTGFRHQYMHISDRSAFDRYLNTVGSLEYAEYYRISMELIDKEPDMYGDLSPILFVSPEKTPGSVADRVKLYRQLMFKEQLMVSSKCIETRKMFGTLPKKVDKGVEQDFQPAEGSNMKHIFDATTYPGLYFWQREGGRKVKPPKSVMRPIAL